MSNGWVRMQDRKEDPDSTRRTTAYQRWTAFLHVIKNDQIHH